MDSHSRSDIDALQTEVRNLKEKNSQMEKLLIQMREEIRQQSSTNTPTHKCGERESFIATESMLHKESGMNFNKGSFAMLPDHDDGEYSVECLINHHIDKVKKVKWI